MLSFTKVRKIRVFFNHPLILRKNALNPCPICRFTDGHIASLPVLEMYTKENCPLCDEAKEQLKRFGRSLLIKEVDISKPENKEWFDKYKYDIPVFHLNGHYLMRHRVHEELLKEKLKDLKKAKHNTDLV